MNDTEFSTQIVERDGRCVFCHRFIGSREHLVAHHILRKRQSPRGRYDQRNAVALCAECHTGSNPQYPSAHKHPYQGEIRAVQHLMSIDVIRDFDHWDEIKSELR